MSHNLPEGATLVPTEFKPRYSHETLEQLQRELDRARLPAETFAMLRPEYGIKYDEVKELLDYWKNSYDIQGHLDARLGSLDNWLVDVPDGGITYEMHFVGYINPDSNAIPLVLLHGWPGSVLEFVDVIKVLKESTSPAFTVIAPSQIGYGWSSKPPLDRHFSVYDSARIINTLVTGLGYTSYVAQGGDIGSMLARILAAKYDACKAININYLPLPPPLSIMHAYLPSPVADYIPSIATSIFNRVTKPLLGEASDHGLSKNEIENAKRQAKFLSSGRGYAIMHGTRPGTIGLVVGSSPVALLAWLGEKFRDWVDPDVPLSQDLILESVSMYWLLDMFPSSIYSYADIPQGVSGWSAYSGNYIKKPFGFSSFAHEIASAPQKWAKTTGNLRFYRYHQRGGHFAALEQPVLFAKDMQDCFNELWPKK